MASGRTIAIGDIHGCSRGLTTQFDDIRPSPADTVVTLGDYIDRGPDLRAEGMVAAEGHAG